MALILADRVKETSKTSGTGTITLAGVIGAFQTFSSAMGNGDTTYYVIENQGQWEVCLGTYSSNTLSRDEVFASSTGSKIDLSGVSIVFCTYPASKSIHLDASNDFSLGNDVICSGLLNLTRSSAGSFLNAYKEGGGQTVALHTDAESSPEWKLGLIASPSESTTPTMGYVFGR